MFLGAMVETFHQGGQVRSETENLMDAFFDLQKADIVKLYPNKDQYMVVLDSYVIDSADQKKKWWNYLFIQELVK